MATSSGRGPRVAHRGQPCSDSQGQLSAGSGPKSERCLGVCGCKEAAWGFTCGFQQESGPGARVQAVAPAPRCPLRHLVSIWPSSKRAPVRSAPGSSCSKTPKGARGSDPEPRGRPPSFAPPFPGRGAFGEAAGVGQEVAAFLSNKIHPVLSREEAGQAQRLPGRTPNRGSVWSTPGLHSQPRAHVGCCFVPSASGASSW